MKCVPLMLSLFSAIPAATASAEPQLSFTKLWTHGHETPNQLSEIPAFDDKTNTIWVVGIVGVDVLNASTGELVEHLDVTDVGFVNGIDIYNGLAALALEARPDRRLPGRVVFYDTRTRKRTGNSVVVGALPDMITFAESGKLVLVANEATPNAVADTSYTTPDPPGTVSIIDVKRRTLVGSPGFAGVTQTGANLRTNSGMDFEPEYIAIDHSGHRAFVTLQEANGIAELDLKSGTYWQVTGLGTKDFRFPGNEIDPKDTDAVIDFRTNDELPPNVEVRGFYMPDSIAAYKFQGQTYLVMANEGDFREDNVDRSAANSAPFLAPSPLDRLRIVNTASSNGHLFAAGARSFSIRDENGALVYDSGNTLDSEAAARQIYDDSRSRDKGVEPEGVALLDIRGRTYAFIGLERTLDAAVAIFDITSPFDVRFVDMIVTKGDVSPEGLAAYHSKGKYYLAIANEIAPPGGKSNTTLYELVP
jgi:hypothetical protein